VSASFRPDANYEFQEQTPEVLAEELNALLVQIAKDHSEYGPLTHEEDPFEHVYRMLGECIITLSNFYIGLRFLENNVRDVLSNAQDK
jgi:hypothetical protein